jgi:hypothetical protein
VVSDLSFFSLSDRDGYRAECMMTGYEDFPLSFGWCPHSIVLLACAAEHPVTPSRE